MNLPAEPCEACDGEGGACCDGRGWVEVKRARFVSGQSLARLARVYGYADLYQFWAARYREGYRVLFRYF